MEALLSDPRIQSAAAPFVVAALLTGIFLYLGGIRGPVIAGLALLIGFFAAYWLVLGPPPWPPRGASHKIAYIVLAAGVLGFLLDLARTPPLGVRIVVIAGGIGAALWLMGARFDLNDPITWLWPALPIVLIWIAVLGRLEARGDDPLAAPALLVVVAVGASLVALYSRSASIAQLAGALGAATAGYAFWNWPTERMELARAALFGAGAAWLGLMTQLALFTRAEMWALVALLVVFLADQPAARVVARFLPTGNWFGRAVGPLAHGALVAIPAAAAVVIAQALAPSGSGY